MQIVFPERCNPQKYYKLHVQYMINSARAAGHIVSIDKNAIPLPDGQECRLIILVDGKKLMVDYCDFPIVTEFELEHKNILKFHKFKNSLKYINPFPPISFYDWSQYAELANEITYTAQGEIISSRQSFTQHQKSAATRRHVQKTMADKYGDIVKYGRIEQVDFWKEISHSLVSVCVPGACSSILDRGQLQWMGFGGCTISPHIDTILPWNRELVSGVHYLECKNDFSNLFALIDWCKDNRDKCVEIGQNAKQLFMETCHPIKAWEWVQECIS